MSFNDSFSFCEIPDLDLHNILSSSPHPNRSRHMTTLPAAGFFLLKYFGKCFPCHCRQNDCSQGLHDCWGFLCIKESVVVIWRHITNIKLN